MNEVFIFFQKIKNFFLVLFEYRLTIPINRKITFILFLFKRNYLFFAKKTKIGWLKGGRYNTFNHYSIFCSRNRARHTHFPCFSFIFAPSTNWSSYIHTVNSSLKKKVTLLLTSTSFELLGSLSHSESEASKSSNPELADIKREQKGQEKQSGITLVEYNCAKKLLCSGASNFSQQKDLTQTKLASLAPCLHRSLCSLSTCSLLASLALRSKQSEQSKWKARFATQAMRARSKQGATHSESVPLSHSESGASYASKSLSPIGGRKINVKDGGLQNFPFTRGETFPLINGSFALRLTSLRSDPFYSKGFERRQKKEGFTSSRCQRSNQRNQARLEQKNQQLSITYEEIGLFPRSFNRVVDRFFKQIFSDVGVVIDEFRFYRYLFFTTVRCLFLLIVIPVFVHFCSKIFLVRPTVNFYWNSQQTEIFLNSHQQKLAFSELQNFEEKLYFESLILKLDSNQIHQKVFYDNKFLENSHLNTFRSSAPSQVKLEIVENASSVSLLAPLKELVKQASDGSPETILSKHKEKQIQDASENAKDINHKQNKFESFHRLTKSTENLQKKTTELALRYNEQSIETITNFFADLIGFGTLCFLFVRLSIQINITKSFLLEVFFGLDDSKKSLFILFVTDLSVGYHSPNIWALGFEFFFNHYGIPESETTIFLLVATLPVLLDVLFKYLIFRHLNRASPATVATYHAMIE